MIKYVPNFLTIIRFLLIPIIVFFTASHNYICAIVVFTISGITDIVDGLIARHFNVISNFGKLMDPLADKATQISLLITLVCLHILPLWILIVIALKECLMISGASFLYGKELVVSSKWYGKLATVLLYIAIICSLFITQFTLEISATFSNSIWLNVISNIDKPIYYIALICTLFSLFMYIKAFCVKGYINKELLK